MADDRVIGVRIGVARVAGLCCDIQLRRGQVVSDALLTLIRHLSLDASTEVRSYVRGLLEPSKDTSDLQKASVARGSTLPSSEFSRPPAPTKSSSSTPVFSRTASSSITNDSLVGRLTDDRPPLDRA